jgi:hypothetical protein
MLTAEQHILLKETEYNVMRERIAELEQTVKDLRYTCELQENTEQS